MQDTKKVQMENEVQDKGTVFDPVSRIDPHRVSLVDLASRIG
jgi:hypothetical protein